MELLLNLVWLLLALPAYWLWRGRAGARTERRFSSLQCLLALGCALVVLFPVISATDDLLAMRAEMEESPASKRSIRQASTDKASAWQSHSAAGVAEATNALVVNDEGWLQLSNPCFLVPASPAMERAGRAPPSSYLG